MMGYFTAPRVAFGPSAIEQLGAVGSKRVLVVGSPSVARTPRFVHALEELRKGGASVTSLVEGTDAGSTEGVEALLAAARPANAETLVAIGGGRTLDTAKGLWLRLAAPDTRLSEIGPLSELHLHERVTFLALPTTAGSGSEVSWSAFLRGPENAILELTHRELQSDWALLDPTFLATLPTPVLAAGAATTLGRAFEAFVSPWSSPFSEALALHALATTVAGLPRVGRHRDTELDASLQLAAAEAGLASANAPGGLLQAGADALAAVSGRPYGRVLAALLPAVVEFVYPSVRDRFGPLVATFGGQAGTSRSAVSDRLREILRGAGLPIGLKEEGAVPGDLGKVADRMRQSPQLSSAARIPSTAELVELLRRAALGVPVDL